MARRTRNMSPSRIKYMLSLKGWNFADIDRKYDLPSSMARKATVYPHSRGEQAIAEVLCKRPEQIWPTRYDQDGVRLKPQPSYDYNASRNFLKGFSKRKISDSIGVAKHTHKGDLPWNQKIILYGYICKSRRIFKLLLETRPCVLAGLRPL